MKILNYLAPIALSAAANAFGEDPVRGVCVDGDMERAFAVTAVIPQKALGGGFSPQVDYAEDGKTPKSITWTEDSKVRPVVTLIGRFKGHEIIDLTFPTADGSEQRSGQPFEAKILAFGVNATASSPMLPFLVIMGDQVASYKQLFKSDATSPFLLEVSRTVSGNGIMWTNFTFGFSDSGAFVREMDSGGRKQKTTVTKFKKDGTVAKTEKLEEN